MADELPKLQINLVIQENVLEEMRKMSAAMGQLNAATDKSAREVREKLNGAITDTQKSVRLAVPSLANFTSAIIKMRIASAATTAVIETLSSPVTAFRYTLDSTLTSFADFQRELANFESIARPTDAELQSVNDTIVYLGEQTQFTATEIAKAATELARLGFSAEKVVGALPGAVNLAIAAQVELAEATEATGIVLNQFGLEANQSTEVVDIMAKSFSSSALDMEKLSIALRFAGASAANTGNTFSETTAALATLADQGITGSIAGTALRRIFSDLNDAGSKLSKRLKELGVSVDADMSEKIRALTEASIDTTQAVDLVGRTAANAAVTLFKSADSFEYFNRQLDPERVRGFAAEIAAIQIDTVRGDMDRLNSVFDTFRRTLGDAFEPAVREGIQDLIDLIQNLTGVVRENSGEIETLGFATRGFVRELRELLPTLSEVAKATPFGPFIVSAKGAVDVVGDLVSTLGEAEKGIVALRDLAELEKVQGEIQKAQNAGDEKRTQELTTQLEILKRHAAAEDRLSLFKEAVRDVDKEIVGFEKLLNRYRRDPSAVKHYEALIKPLQEQKTSLEEAVLATEELIRKRKELESQAKEEKPKSKIVDGVPVDEEEAEGAKRAADLLKKIQEQLAIETTRFLRGQREAELKAQEIYFKNTEELLKASGKSTADLVRFNSLRIAQIRQKYRDQDILDQQKQKEQEDKFQQKREEITTEIQNKAALDRAQAEGGELERRRQQVEQWYVEKLKLAKEFSINVQIVETARTERLEAIEQEYRNKQVQEAEKLSEKILNSDKRSADARIAQLNKVYTENRNLISEYISDEALRAETLQAMEQQHQDEISKIQDEARRERMQKIQEYVDFVRETTDNIGKAFVDLYESQINGAEYATQRRVQALEYEKQQSIQKYEDLRNQGIKLTDRQKLKEKQAIARFEEQKEAIEQQGFEKTRELRNKERDAQAIMTGIQGAAAAIRALSELGPIAGAIAAGTISAATAAAIVEIKSQEFAKGGIVEGQSYYGDQVPAMVNSGEMVLTRVQQNRLFNMLDGKSDSGFGMTGNITLEGTTVNIYGNVSDPEMVKQAVEDNDNRTLRKLAKQMRLINEMGIRG